MVFVLPLGPLLPLFPAKYFPISRHRCREGDRMFAVVTSILVLLASIAVCVRADPNPNGPGPGEVFIEGKPCTVSWDVDTTGRWKTMHIDLMTGDNFDMVFLANVGTVDGSNPSKTSYTYTCPQVKPHSAIYFYQFWTDSSSNKTWTGRFAITDSSKRVAKPSQSTQPDSANIPWGRGALVNGSSITSSLIESATAKSTSTMGPTSPAHSNTMTETAHQLAPSSDLASATPSAGNAVSSGANSALEICSVSRLLFQTGFILGLAALGFIVIC